MDIALKKIKGTMCNCGSLSLKHFKHNARLTIVSSVSVVEGGAHDVIVKPAVSNEIIDEAKE